MGRATRRALEVARAASVDLEAAQAAFFRARSMYEARLLGWHESGRSSNGDYAGSL